MAKGWVNDDSVHDQISDSISDEITRARNLLPTGESLWECEECGESIPPARREAVPGVRLCVACQKGQDKKQARPELYNRRGSKDSQLK